MIEITKEKQAIIKIIGVGGGGGKAINTMIAKGLTGVEFIAMDTDEQDLRRSLATNRLLLDSLCPWIHRSNTVSETSSTNIDNHRKVPFSMDACFSKRPGHRTNTDTGAKEEKSLVNEKITANKASKSPTGDPVRTYLSKRGAVSLLSRAGEIEIAKRMEESNSRRV